MWFSHLSRSPFLSSSLQNTARRNWKIVDKVVNPCPTEPGYTLSLQTVQIQISWLLKKPTDLDLHCLPISMWHCINNLNQVIWLAENYKWVWHFNIFSMTVVKTEVIYEHQFRKYAIWCSFRVSLSTQSDQSPLVILWIAKGFFRQKAMTKQTADVQADLCCSWDIFFLVLRFIICIV